MSKVITLNLPFLGTVYVRNADTPDAEVRFRLSRKQVEFVRSFYDKSDVIPLTFALCEVYEQGNGWAVAWPRQGEDRNNTCFRAVENIEFALAQQARGVMKKPSIGFMDQARTNARIMGDIYRKARDASPTKLLVMKTKQISVANAKRVSRVINRAVQTFKNEEINILASWEEARAMREKQKAQDQRASEQRLQQLAAAFSRARKTAGQNLH